MQNINIHVVHLLVWIMNCIIIIISFVFCAVSVIDCVSVSSAS